MFTVKIIFVDKCVQALQCFHFFINLQLKRDHFESKLLVLAHLKRRAKSD